MTKAFRTNGDLGRDGNMSRTVVQAPPARSVTDDANFVQCTRAPCATHLARCPAAHCRSGRAAPPAALPPASSSPSRKRPGPHLSGRVQVRACNCGHVMLGSYGLMCRLAAAELGNGRGTQASATKPPPHITHRNAVNMKAVFPSLTVLCLGAQHDVLLPLTDQLRLKPGGLGLGARKPLALWVASRWGSYVCQRGHLTRHS